MQDNAKEELLLSVKRVFVEKKRLGTSQWCFDLDRTISNITLTKSPDQSEKGR